ncbi:Tex family protein [Marinoscillum sp. MHG1-6]|uniref:Tex family protein n=1 Tax=Marinoscillum sp. MHG1-6 TaxID=2959627 RepID=UPI002157AE2D|nr:Tex family protein [Marinoscillum sp. MHG1-6]
MTNYAAKIAQELSLQSRFVDAVIQLLDEGATVPFISRYRKEMTGTMDEVQVAQVRDRVSQLRELDKRKEAILKSIDEQGKLTPELKSKIDAAETMAVLEDLYLPYKPKRKTKASVAKEKGLEPLANMLFAQNAFDTELEAAKFISDEKGVADVEEALQGARDIIAEWVSEDADSRKKIRTLFQSEGVVTAKLMRGKEQEGAKYKDYFDWQESLKDIPSHRLLAIRRGEKEGILSMDIAPEEESAIALLNRQFVKSNNAASVHVETAVKDSYKRLIKPSIETESRLESKKKADLEAIGVFSENLKQLLMSAPLGQKTVLGIDPGFRTGCKVVCLDKQGKLLENTTIYPNEPQKDKQTAGAIVMALAQKHNIEAVAIGNGTASRETEQFVKSLGLPKNIIIAMVNESGASIYSASEVAREEFPNHDITVRGAVSIGRRMMDPLAELVKIDAKSIGVGQYQHDVDQNSLKSSLDDVVMSCVNAVGVELNTASKQLLTYVSGLGPQLADNIIQFRNENGAFKSREDLKKVPRLGDKAFEQAAGFLRIGGGKNVLDQSAVHPERYETVETMAKDLGCTVVDLVKDSNLRQKIDLKKYVTEEVGLPTLQDIIQELAKPGRDPREQFEAFAFDDHVHDIKDLTIGMKLPGIITNITKFGAFVDVGVHQDGLVHVSHLSDSFVSDPAQAVKLQQKVTVTVLEVDVPRKRISLSMKSDPFGKSPAPKQRKKREEPQVEGDLQAKLAMLKGKFGN